LIAATKYKIFIHNFNLENMSINLKLEKDNENLEGYGIFKILIEAICWELNMDYNI
jgi:hypothetical protein